MIVWVDQIETECVPDPLNPGALQIGSGGAGQNNSGIYKNPCAYAGRALPPSAYAQAGQADNGHPINFILDALTGFKRGHFADAQPYASGSPLQRAAYGNYVFGVFMQSAGLSLGDTLTAANAFADLSGAQYPGRQMDSNYPSIPTANVVNITAGYLQQSVGATCQP
jgi:hypothetical protein